MEARTIAVTDVEGRLCQSLIVLRKKKDWWISISGVWNYVAHGVAS